MTARISLWQTLHIDTPPTDWDPAMTTQGQKLLGMYKCADNTKNCKFHLPTAPAPPPVALAAPSDPCNAYATCAECVGTTVGKQICGWCSGALEYNGTQSTSHCSGWDGTAQKDWKCYGDYSTGTCPSYFKCDAGACSPTADPAGSYPDKKTCEDQCGGAFVKAVASLERAAPPPRRSRAPPADLLSARSATSTARTAACRSTWRTRTASGTRRSRPPSRTHTPSSR